MGESNEENIILSQEIANHQLNNITKAISNNFNDLPLLVDNDLDNILQKEVEEEEDNGMAKEENEPFSFDWIHFKFNLEPNFFIYAFLLSLHMAQDLFLNAAFLELQLDKIVKSSEKKSANKNLVTFTSSDYLSYMKWSGIILTTLQMLVISQFGKLLDTRGIRFTTLVFFALIFLNGSIVLYTMSSKYNFEICTYLPLKIIGGLDGGSTVLLTIVQNGITDLFTSHEQRIVSFNYILSSISVISFIVPIFTTFFIKKFGKFTILKVSLFITIVEFSLVYLFLNDAKVKKQTQTTTTNNNNNKNSQKVIHKPSDSLLVSKNHNFFTNFLLQFKVLVLPKSDPIARKNVFFLIGFKVTNYIFTASGPVVIAYLMLIFNFDAIKLNYLVAFIGLYGAICSVSLINLFYYIISNILKMKHNPKKFDKIDKIQLFLLAFGSFVAFNICLFLRKHLSGILAVLVILTTFDFCVPVINNSIVKSIEHTTRELEEEVEEEQLLLNNDQNINTSEVPERTKTGTIYACFSILDKLVMIVFSATMFQVFDLSKDSKPWLFLILPYIGSCINLALCYFVHVDKYDSNDYSEIPV